MDNNLVVDLSMHAYMEAVKSLCRVADLAESVEERLEVRRLALAQLTAKFLALEVISGKRPNQDALMQNLVNDEVAKFQEIARG